MHELGIFTGADLYKQDEMTLIRLFGKMGYSLYRKVRGIHDAPVQVTRDRKSVGKEHTYGTFNDGRAGYGSMRQLAGVERALQRVQNMAKQ